MTRKLFALTLLVITVASMFTGGMAGAQDSQGEALPPHVIDVWPLPGVELAGGEPLTVTFDQPMDAASVEAAFAFAPALEGAFAWPDARTVDFTPAAGWPPGNTYTVTVGTGATAENGLTLEEAYAFEAKTVGPLAVGTVSPSPGAEGVAADALIVATFNRPVVPLVSTGEMGDLPSPITIAPAVEGVGEWLNTSIYTFTPAAPLAGGTAYTVTIPAGLTSVDGAALEEAYSWTFRTLPPQILSIIPGAGQERVLLDAPVVIAFSQPMDTASTEAAFSLLYEGQPVAGAFRWNADNSELTFTPAERLSLESTYVINIAPTARGARGDATLAEGQSISFTTVPLPGVLYTEPANGATGVEFWRDVTFGFRSPMNMDTFEGRVVIEPAPATWEPYTDSEGLQLHLSFKKRANTTYTITLNAGMEDLYGNAIPTDYVLTFTTAGVQNQAYPFNVGRIAITGSYREDTAIPVVVSGTPTVDFALYRLDLMNLEDAAIGPYWDNTVPVWANRQTVLREWTQTFDSGGEDQVLRDALLASEEGGQLPPGLYWLISRFPSGEGGNLSQMALVVGNANLTVKRTPDEALVWVTDTPTAAPVAGATVTIYHHNQPIARGETDADGLFRAPVDVPKTDAFLAILAEGPETYGVWTSDYEPQPPDKEGYLYTDRPIYRPGETVYFRGVIRDKDDMTLTVPNIRNVRVKAGSWWADETYFDGEVEVTDFGTFSGSFVLPEEAGVGEGFVRVEPDMNFGEYPASVGFTVAEYRVPEFEVSVTAQQDAIFQGEPLNAVAEATYYFGGAVGNAVTSWYAYGEPTSLNYTGTGNYHFGSDDWRYYWEDFGSGEGATDENGRYLFTIEDTTPESPRPYRITVEATVTDESQLPITGRTSLTLHPADVYVGMRTDHYFGQAGEPLTIELIAVDTASAPLAARRIDLVVEQIQWKRTPVEGRLGRYTWEEQITEIETAQAITDADGKASYVFTPPDSGVYRVRAAAMDEKERINRSALRFWVAGPSDIWWSAPYYESTYIEMVADKDLYRPGDTARLLVPLPYSGRSTVLVTTERVDVMSTEVIEAEGSSLFFDVPITDDSAPTIHVSVTVVKGIDDESAHPDYRQGSISLDVEPVDRRLAVTVTPSTTRAQPRDEVTFDVQVTDANGEPAVAEVGLALVDKAILALRPPNSISLEEEFYGYQYDSVSTSVSIYALLDRFEELAEGGRGGGGGGGGGEVPFIREEFEQTPLWAPHVVTDEAGRASVSVTLPDNLTTWQLDARGVTMETHVGQTTTEVMTTLPLLVRPVAPRFFVVGDRAQLAAVINNNTADAQTVEARLEAEGVVLEGEAAQEVTVSAGGRARVEWDVVVQDVDYVDLTFFAVNEAYQDAAKPALATGPDGTIPVYRYTAPDTVGTGGILREAGAKTEAVSLPPRLDTDQGALTVRLEPSLAVAATDAFDYLENFPHQCIEQTVSKFLPNAVTYRALRALDITDPMLEAGLAQAVEKAVAKLAQAQNPDGGWGWFGGMESDPLTTAYAALGLIEAREAGFAVDETMLSRALNYVQAQLIRPRLETPDWQLNRQAFYLYVLARDGIGLASDYAALVEQRMRMSYAGRAFLIMAFDALFPGNMAMDVLASDLTSAAKLSATGAHWEEEYADWWNWGSDTRTTALVLDALIRAAPESDLLPNAVRWLMVARQGDHWQTTQETVWAVIAFTEWMTLTGELQGRYDYSLSVNREPLAEQTVTPETVRQGEVLRVAVSDLLRDAVNRVVVARGEGEGVLYYTAHLDLRLPASEVKALSRGITVQRAYFLAGDSDTPVASAKLGDVINVRLTLTLPEDVYYFVLEDPIPAGTEGVDTSLLTTSRAVEEPTLEREGEEDLYWYWGWWWFDRTEIRDEQTNLYADYLPRGTYVYTYQVRATVAGAFQTMPAHAYAFYFPEVFGRTDGALFTVAPAPVE